MSKEAERRASARKQGRNAKAAKTVIIGVMVLVIPVLIVIAIRG